MAQVRKILESILRGVSDGNIAFRDLRRLLEELGFECRVRGDHFIYTKPGIEDIVNIQPMGSKAKRYQVKQVRELILRHRLGEQA